jgi:alkanesulfonate monooxygenase
MVARYADQCNFSFGEDSARKLEVLRQCCAQVGRDYGTIEKTAAIWPVDPGRDHTGVPEILGRLRDAFELGFTTAQVIVTDSDPVPLVEILGEDVLPEVSTW